MKIAVLGTRGFPDVQGGVEAHCENLYPRLVKLGCEVVVFSRRPYVNYETSFFEGVKLISLPCPKSKFLEAIIHTWRGVFAAKKIRPDILHIHAIGPALLTPLARILGMRVVLTHHGPDYLRKKWNWFAKVVLWCGEFLGVLFSCEVIAVSQGIAEDLKKRFKKEIVYIPNGVRLPDKNELDGEIGILEKYGLEKERYFLAVARFVPEKGLEDLVDAFIMAKTQAQERMTGWKLVLAGEAFHQDEYSRRLERKAKEAKDIVLTGALPFEVLKGLYRFAGVFVLPSYYEGLPLVLLEAMSFGLLCLVSDIPACRQLKLNEENYFPCGDVWQLSKKLREFSQKKITDSEKSALHNFVVENFDWEKIASKTFMLYQKVRGRSSIA